MTDRLAECASCSRHVKVCDTVCPFCGASRGATQGRRQEPFRRLTAAAAVAAGVSALTACGSGSQPERAPSGGAFYGSPGIVTVPDAAKGDLPDGSVDGATVDSSADGPIDGASVDGSDVDAP
jgi:hypothetical protein